LEQLLKQHFAQVFPVYVCGLWLVVTTILANISGWFALQNRFPVRPAQELQKLRFQSAAMGKGAAIPKTSFNAVLIVVICAEGLKIDIIRIFGLFSRPFFVPWDEITLTTRRRLFGMVTDLTFGTPAIATMTARGRLAERIREAHPAPLP
jgi:hypothetical protein